MLAKKNVSTPDTSLKNAFIAFLSGDRSASIHECLYKDEIDSQGQNFGLGEQNTPKTKSDDYYIFTSEKTMIARFKEQIAARVFPAQNMIELGIGSRQAVIDKTLPLLKALLPAKFFANDISAQATKEARALIGENIPALPVTPIVGNFLGDDPILKEKNATVMLLGSTVSNIAAYNGAIPVNEVVGFMRKLKGLAGENGRVIITQDTNQDPESLKASYATPELCAFRLEALNKLKSIFNLSSFNIDLLSYEPVWDAKAHLLVNTFVNTKEQIVKIDDTQVVIPEGQRLYMSNSYKYPAADFLHMARIAGLAPVQTWMDAQDRVALHVLRPQPSIMLG